MTQQTDSNKNPVLPLAAVPMPELEAMLDRYGLTLVRVAANQPIPGSFWGEPEAGLGAGRLYARADTPVHSVLHEACHWICMSPDRREGLDTDAGGDTGEENGVCYLQILLADFVPGMGRMRMLADMDTWGYSFRLGSAKSWFDGDAEDARDWLIAHGLIDSTGAPNWRCRDDTATDPQLSND